MMKFKSKISYGIFVPLFLSLAFILVVFIYQNIWIGLLLILPLVVFIVHLYLNTYYSIEDNNLIIKSGFLVNKKIDINSIEKIAETTNPISSPALSLDRLEIKYNTNQSVLISPEEKIEFINELLKINSSIQIKFFDKK